MDTLRSKALLLKALLARVLLTAGTLPSQPNAERGSGLAEFALILALVVVVAIAALQGLGGDITDILGQVRAAL